MGVKYYNSMAWMKRKLYHDKLTPQEIAKICGVEPMTIYRKIKEFKL